MLEIQNISKSYGSKKALQDCTITANKHDIVGILGQNGCGKSTLFKCIMGLCESDSGSVRYESHVCDFNQRKRFGYMPEQRSLFLDLTIYEQLKFLGELKGLEISLIEVQINVLLDRFGLMDKKNQVINKLSKGQQQKVQLIAALLHNPDVLILDEPLNGLDFYSVQIVMDEITRQA